MKQELRDQIDQFMENAPEDFKKKYEEELNKMEKIRIGLIKLSQEAMNTVSYPFFAGALLVLSYSMHDPLAMEKVTTLLTSFFKENLAPEDNDKSHVANVSMLIKLSEMGGKKPSKALGDLENGKISIPTNLG